MTDRDDSPDTGRSSWPPNGARKWLMTVLGLLLVAGVGGAVATFSQSAKNGDAIGDVRSRQDRHEVRGHAGTAEDLSEIREDVAELKSDVGALKATVEHGREDARETRDDVKWLRRRMGGGR